MNNADMPAMPITLEDGEVWSETEDHALGLTKREHFAITLSMGSDEVEFNDKATFEQFIGRSIDESDPFDMIRAACELEAKFRVMKADALLSELERKKS